MSPLGWVGAAALTGFASAGIFSSWLHWPRAWFVLGHAGAVVLLLIAFVRNTGIQPAIQLQRRWVSDVLGGVVIGAVLVRSVAGQPASAHPEGSALVEGLLWLGIVHGVADALLLSVVPVAVVAPILAHGIIHSAAVVHGMETTTQLPPHY